VLYSLGSLLSELGEYGQSRLSLEESLQLRLAAQDSMGVLECQRSLGRLASTERRYAIAKEWFYKAYSGAQRENKPEMEMALKAQLGMVACLEGDRATARKWVTQGLEYWQARKHPTWIAEMECDLSQIALAEGKAQEAEDRAERSLNLYRQVADQQGIAQASFALANALTNLGHYDSARDHYRGSLVYANEKGLRPLSKQISESLRLLEVSASRGQ
jgi:tetratricopeptide (TPR) repeat protein